MRDGCEDTARVLTTSVCAMGQCVVDLRGKRRSGRDVAIAGPPLVSRCSLLERSFRHSQPSVRKYLCSQVSLTFRMLLPAPWCIAWCTLVWFLIAGLHSGPAKICSISLHRSFGDLLIVTIACILKSRPSCRRRLIDQKWPQSCCELCLA